MRALLFLYVRTLFNGVRRAFSSPTRSIGVLFFILTQLLWLPRLMFSPRAFDELPTPQLGHLSFPPLDLVEAVSFGAFSFLSVLFALNLFNYRGNFRSADVDVLFPTPVSPRLVLLGRVMRDIWLSLLAPLFFAVLFWRPVKWGWAALFTNLPNPALANSALRVAGIAFLLLAIAWVWIGYAASLVLGRPEEKTERARSWLTAALLLGFVALGYTAYRELGQTPQLEAWVKLAKEPYLRVALLPATAATALTMGPLRGDVVSMLIGGVGLLGLSLAAWAVASLNTTWMYEQAALRAAVTESTIKLRRSGDMYASVAQRARSGRLKAHRWRWFLRLSPSGPRALLWKDLLVQSRTSLWSTVFLLVLSAGMAYMTTLIPLSNESGAGFLLLFLQSMFLLGPTVGYAQAGFIESLRRIDLLKPLPFPSQAVVFMEVLAKAIGPIVVSVIGLMAGLVFRPELWPYVVSGWLLFPPLTMALSAVSLFLVILLPDVEDPTQRSFRGLATLLGMALCSGPPIVLFAALVLLKVPVVVAAVPTAGLMAFVCWLATRFAGQVYEDFNPSE